MKYTALEIVTLTGIESPTEKFGKVGINIAGVPVNNPNHLVNLQDATTATVRVGADSFEVDLPEQAEPSDAVKAVVEARGKETSAAFEAQQIAKGRIKAPEQDEPAPSE